MTGNWRRVGPDWAVGGVGSANDIIGNAGPIAQDKMAGVAMPRRWVMGQFVIPKSSVVTGRRSNSAGSPRPAGAGLAMTKQTDPMPRLEPAGDFDPD